MRTGKGALIPAAALLVLLVLSCSFGGAGGTGEETGMVLDTRNFWARELDTKEFYQLQADLLAEGRYCKVWVEQESREKKLAGFAVARAIARDYDENIYPKMIKSFGLRFKDDDGTVKNTMELADWLTDKDGKLSILLLDIQDGGGSSGYTEGYFTPLNFYEPGDDPDDPEDESYYSNKTDMIYIDTYPGKPGEPGANDTLAHEMQHLMNYTTTVAVRRNNDNTLNTMDTWIDEGLASAAEYIYHDGHPADKYAWFDADPEGTIARGNNFFVWGNHGENSNLDDYATVYLFFQWLRLQSVVEEERIYQNIIASPDSDYQAVTGAAARAIPGEGFDQWDVLLKTWLAANYINAPNGKYGYKDDSVLKEVRAKIADEGTESLPLFSGEGVYSMYAAGKGDISVNYKPNSGSNIEYVSLSKSGEGVVDDDSIPSDGALLTYNINTDTDKDGTAETGNLTGVGDPSETSSSVSLAARSAAATAWKRPFRIDARDMLVRNGHSEKAFVPGALLPGNWVLEGYGE